MASPGTTSATDSYVMTRPLAKAEKDFTEFEKRSEAGPLWRLFKSLGARGNGFSHEDGINVELKAKEKYEVVRARVVFCKCFGGEWLSATFRFVGDVPDGVDLAPAARSVIPEESSYSFADKQGIHSELYERIWPTSCEETELVGLIYVTGATKSGKNTLAKALIQRYLCDPRFVKTWNTTRERRPHLVTFEDPIETYYSKEKAPLNPKELQALGLDYTPRERRKDTAEEDALKEVLSNALRQTPSVVFAAETRDGEELRRLVQFAGTGHLVITTGHAHSLRESMGTLLAACQAVSPAARREVADKLCAVIHLNPEPLGTGLLRIPTLYRANVAGRQALMAEGRACLLPYSSDGPDGYCWGRRWFIEKLDPTLKAETEFRAFRERAADQDLIGL